MLDGGNDDGARQGREPRTPVDRNVRERLRALRRHRVFAWPQTAVALGTILLLGGILGFLIPKKVEVADQYASVIAMIFGVLTLSFSVYQAVSQWHTGNRQGDGGASAPPPPKFRKFGLFMQGAVGGTVATCAVGGFISSGPNQSPTVREAGLAVEAVPDVRRAACGTGVRILTLPDRPPIATPPVASWQPNPADSLAITSTEVETRFTRWVEDRSAIPVGPAKYWVRLTPLGGQPVQLLSMEFRVWGDYPPTGRIAKMACRSNSASLPPGQSARPDDGSRIAPRRAGVLRIDLAEQPYVVRNLRVPPEGTMIEIEVRNSIASHRNTQWQLIVSTGGGSLSYSQSMVLGAAAKTGECRWAADGKSAARQPTACPTFRP